MRQIPPRVVTTLAGGICRDVSPFSLVISEGQQLSAQMLEAEPASELLAHPPPIAGSIMLESVDV